MKWYLHVLRDGDHCVAKFLREDSRMSGPQTDREVIFGPVGSELLIEFLEKIDAAKSGKVDASSLDPVDRAPIWLWLHGYTEGMQHSLNHLTHHQ